MNDLVRRLRQEPALVRAVVAAVIVAIPVDAQWMNAVDAVAVILLGYSIRQKVSPSAD